jgi:CRISPR type IV-associated protein Csf3
VDLGSPVASSDPFIHLDSFLSYAAGIEAIGWDGLQRLEESDEPEYFEDEMPLEKIEVDGEWVWACSSAQIASPDEDMDGSWNVARWRKRFDHDLEHSVKDTQINITTGDFKSYNAALPYKGVRRLLFFFRGDPDRVKEMVESHVAAIGKKSSQGFGAVNDVEVSEAEDMESAVYHEGHVLRSIPAGFLDGVEPGVRIERRTTKPPYWHADNQCMAVAPFEEIPEEKLQDAVVDG